MIPIKAVKEAAFGKWGRIYQALVPEFETALSKAPRHVPCPHPSHSAASKTGRNSRDGFRMHRSYPDNGFCICNTCGYFDGFAAIQWIRGYASVVDAIKDVSQYLGLTAKTERFKVKYKPRVICKKPRPRPLNKSKQAYYQRILDEAYPGNHPLAYPLQVFFAERGISKIPDILRFTRCLPYYDMDDNGNRILIGEYPAMLAPIISPEQGLIGIHRTYLDETGRKAPVPASRKQSTYAGDHNGCAIPLYEPQGVIHGVAEGIETSLAPTEALGIPTWSCINAGGLEKVKLPPKVKTVLVWTDLDRSGRGLEAAKKFEALNPDREVRILIPPGEIPDNQKSVDWSDIWRQYGPEPFFKAIK